MLKACIFLNSVFRNLNICEIAIFQRNMIVLHKKDRFIHLSPKLGNNFSTPIPNTIRAHF